MNKKDIEKQILNENSNIKVPDVFSKVSKAPLNKLLTGETPVQAFKKQFANMLLIFTALLFIIVTIAVAALVLAPTEQTTVQASNSYLSISITTSENVSTKYGFVIDTSGNVILAEKEKVGDTFVFEKLTIKNNDIEDTIVSVLTPNIGDSVYVSSLNTDTTVANNLASNARNGINKAYGETSKAYTYELNKSVAINYLVSIINEKSAANVSNTDNVGDIIGCYLSICG